MRRDLDAIMAKLWELAPEGVLDIKAEDVAAHLGVARSTWLGPIRTSLGDRIRVEAAKGRKTSRITLVSNRPTNRPNRTVQPSNSRTVSGVRTNATEKRTNDDDDKNSCKARTVQPTVRIPDGSSVVVVRVEGLKELIEELRALRESRDPAAAPKPEEPALPPGVDPQEFEEAVSEKFEEMKAGEQAKGKPIKSPSKALAHCRRDLLKAPDCFGEVKRLSKAWRERKARADAEAIRLEAAKKKAEAIKAQLEAEAQRARAQLRQQAATNPIPFKIHKGAM